MATQQQPAKEHVISYAYPTSDEARRHKRGDTGCFVLSAINTATAFDSFEKAKSAAMALGTTPGRWSFDHTSALTSL